MAILVRLAKALGPGRLGMACIELHHAIERRRMEALRKKLARR